MSGTKFFDTSNVLGTSSSVDWNTCFPRVQSNGIILIALHKICRMKSLESGRANDQSVRASLKGRICVGVISACAAFKS
jgi:hypothetical protein